MHFDNVITSDNFGSAANCVGVKVPLACFRLGDEASWSGFSHGSLKPQVSPLLESDGVEFWEKQKMGFWRERNPSFLTLKGERRQQKTIL